MQLAERRDSLLDIVLRLLLEGGPPAVTMGTVVGRAGVTRTLVYKHFDNKDDLLVAVYRREATKLDRAIRTVVEAAPEGFEPKLRAYVSAVLEQVAASSGTFVPLRGAGGARTARRDQRGWDRRTVKYFASLAAKEFGLDERDANTAISTLFASIPTLLGQLRSRRAAIDNDYLVETYTQLVLGGLSRLAKARDESAEAVRPA